MGAAAIQLSAVTPACKLMLMRSFDGLNTRASLTATAASFLIILRHTRLLPLCRIPPPLPPWLHPSHPLLLAFTCPQSSGEITRARLQCPAALRCSALPYPYSTHTHMDTQIQCRHGPKQARHSNYIDILLSNVCLEQSEGAFHCAASSIKLGITTSIVLMQVNEKEPSSCLMDFHALGYLQSIFSLICITFAGFHYSSI